MLRHINSSIDPPDNDEDEILEILRKQNAFFPRGHYVLASRKHSEYYVFVRLALSYKTERSKIARMVVRSFKDGNIDAVAAFTVGGALLGKEVSELLASKWVVGKTLEHGEIEFLNLSRISKSDNVLVLDDVLSTGASLRKAIAKIESLTEGRVTGIAVVVSRSDNMVKQGAKEIRLLSVNFPQYEPSDCPLCKRGLPLLDLSLIESKREVALSVLTGNSRTKMAQGFRYYDEMLSRANKESQEE